MKLIKHEKYEGMYYIEWPNKDRSVTTKFPEYEGGHYGFYNKTNAKEIMKREGVEEYERGITYNNPLGRPETGSGCV